MKEEVKKTRFVISGIIITFFSVSILGTGFLFILVRILAEILKYPFWLGGTFLLIIANSFLEIAVYFIIKKRIGKYGKTDNVDMEWLIQLDIILAQLAGVSMILPLATVIYWKMFGRSVMACIVCAMAVPVVIMLIVICLKAPYLQAGTLSKDKKEKSKMKALQILAAVMCILLFAGIILGSEIMRERYLMKFFKRR